MTRQWKTALLWFGLAVVMFLAAGWLTFRITAINGETLIRRMLESSIAPPVTVPPSPLAGGKPAIVEAVSRMEQAKPTDAPPQTQTIAIYARDPSEDLAQKIDIGYFVLPGGSLFDPGYTVYVSIKFPAGTDTRIILANVVDEKSCSVGQTGVLMLPDYMHPANPSPRPAVRKFALADGTAYFVVDPGKPATDFTVSCNLKDAAVNHTYTRRGANFEFTDFKSRMTSFLMPGFMDALNGYSPLAREAVNFGGIEGAEQFWFYGGYQDQRLASFESARVFAPGQQVYVTWSDVDREQNRDLLLVVIGILIGLGVTMFIEGLRPLIDALLEQKKRARHH